MLDALASFVARRRSVLAVAALAIAVLATTTLIILFLMTGSVVLPVKALFCIALGAFSTSAIVFIKELGVGVALAVLIDAFLIRTLLVPSPMAMLRRWNWWAPPPLAGLHARFGPREEAPA